ncbi:MAG: caspase domain-containing protein [Flavobacteriaceae bacterium]
MTRLALPVLLAALCLCLPATASIAAGGKVKALLVGVSDYENLDDNYDLRGPGNDVREFTRLLTDRGVDPADITVLADAANGLPEGVSVARPTRAAILSALDELVHAGGQDTTILFYFSGHGSRQPDRNGDENGGPDEIFLPIDTGRWNGGAGEVENAIVDDELQEKARAILATGATFIAIVDACHSATGFRDISARVRSREVAPDVLGVPQGEGDGEGETAATGGAPAAKPLTGNYVFLYSTQADQRAYEYPAGPDAPPTQWYGDFTFNLLSGLRQTPDVTWRQLLQAVSDRMRNDSTVGVQRPDAEGPLLDVPVFLARGEGGARRYRVDGATFSAGLMDGLGEGATVALYADATGSGEDRLGTATVSALDATTSTLEGEVPQGARYGEIVTAGSPRAVVFSRPIRADAGDGADYAGIEAAIAEIVGGEHKAFAFADEGYDLALVLTGGTLAIGNRAGEIDSRGPATSFRFDFAGVEDVAETLADGLSRIARVQTLYRAAASVSAAAQTAFVLPGGGITTSLSLVKAPEGAGAAKRCPKPPTLRGEPVSGDAPHLSHCDVVVLEIANGTSTAQDVTVLYVDAAFAIQPLWPRPGTSNRVAFGESVKVPIQITLKGPDGKPLASGEERLVVLAVPAPPEKQERTVLTGLAQDGIARDVAPGSVEGWLRASMDPDRASRSTFAFAQPPALTVRQHDFLVAP